MYKFSVNEFLFRMQWLQRMILAATFAQDCNNIMITWFVILARNAVVITECWKIKSRRNQLGSTLVQDTDHWDQNPDRALAQFKSNDDDYSELFGKCGYFNIKSIHKTLFYKHKDNLFIIHFNIRSLQKNVETLNNYLSQLDK